MVPSTVAADISGLKDQTFFMMVISAALETSSFILAFDGEMVRPLALETLAFQRCVVFGDAMTLFKHVEAFFGDSDDVCFYIHLDFDVWRFGAIFRSFHSSRFDGGKATFYQRADDLIRRYILVDVVDDHGAIRFSFWRRRCRNARARFPSCRIDEEIVVLCTVWEDEDAVVAGLNYFPNLCCIRGVGVDELCKLLFGRE